MSSPANRVDAANAPDARPLRFVTAASLFDGHDAAINIMRRLIQAQGVEVVHLGHNRSVEDVVRAALQEDADAIALSSYQGGHVEYFKYMVDMLKERHAGHIRVFGGGGGTITPEEIAELQAYGVERIYHPNDGMHLGLVAMIEDVVRRTSEARVRRNASDKAAVVGARSAGDTATGRPQSGLLQGATVDLTQEIAIAHQLSAIENSEIPEAELAHLRKQWQLAGSRTPVIGLTGTGGAGKSSVTDELLNRFLASFPEMRIAVVSVDPTRRRTGGALLGDRIRMNSLRSMRVFMRSMATRRQHVATNTALKDVIAYLKGQGYDLVMVETAGIGQSDSEIVDLVDFPVYVMTSDYGAPSQLEKIDMIDFAELIVLNKFDKRGAEDALRDVRKQWKRNRTAFKMKDDEVPVYPTIASQFNDPGITWMFVNLCRLLREKLKLGDDVAVAGAHAVGDASVGARLRATDTPTSVGAAPAASAATPQSEDTSRPQAGSYKSNPRVDWQPNLDTSLREPRATVLIPGNRVRYLAEIAEQGRAINKAAETQAEIASRAQSYYETLKDLGDDLLPKSLELYAPDALLAAPVGAAPAAMERPSHARATEQTSRGRGAVGGKAREPGEWPSHDNEITAGRDGEWARPGRDHYGRDTGTAGSGRENASAGTVGGAEAARGMASAGIVGGAEAPTGAPVDRSLLTLRQRYNDAINSLTAESLKHLREWPARFKSVTDPVNEYKVRDKVIRVENYRESLSHQKIPKIAAPRYRDWGDLLKFLHKENLPGAYPYTAGVYPYRRTGEDPTRMFAGEGTPERTNRRFHYLSHGQGARLSTAFDSVTLYGEDPHPRPDIFGKIGNSGVNIPTLDDMKKLYSGFDLCAPTTSVSMTINGPAPIILAMFMNTAIDQQVEKYLREDPARWDAAHAIIEKIYEGKHRPMYSGPLPDGNDGLGLGLLGVAGNEVVPPDVYEKIKQYTMSTVRGTVQADILKEDQAQNTCIFSTEFALRMMGDIQQSFVDRKVRNFYSVSISGYHIAEAGANPISQLAFTLSNGFTIVEYYLARGMKIDDFAPNLSFFFSNGMDPEYTAIGRVARRIWARAMRERYGADARSQMLKYHIQTSGRSLHAQEIQFNDIRTTLQALYALFDNCNSLHTNAYDEAITTPTEESVRRAVAIQLIINRELGLNFNENPWQGSFVVDELTDLVEEAVYREFEAISERGGVLGAMDTMYQRGKIQEESLYYESKKHDGSLPLIGVNTFLPKEHAGDITTTIELIRSTEGEKNQQISNVEGYRANRNTRAVAVAAAPSTRFPVGSAAPTTRFPERGAEGAKSKGDATVEAHPVGDQSGAEAHELAAHGIKTQSGDPNVPGTLTHLQSTARARANLFEALLEAVKYNSLGQISHALYDVGGEYRRNM